MQSWTVAFIGFHALSLFVMAIMIWEFLRLAHKQQNMLASLDITEGNRACRHKRGFAIAYIATTLLIMIISLAIFALQPHVF